MHLLIIYTNCSIPLAHIHMNPPGLRVAMSYHAHFSHLRHSASLLLVCIHVFSKDVSYARDGGQCGHEV